jgi:hypothetical protein
MLSYQSTWGLQTAIVALEDRSLEHAGGGLMQPACVSLQSTPPMHPSALTRWSGAKIGMGTRQEG